MPFNGSGIFNPLITFVPNTLATAEDQNTQDVDFAGGLSDCMTRDGQASATASLSMGGFRLNDVGTPVAGTDAATMAWVETFVSTVTINVRAAIAGGTDTATTLDSVIYWNYAFVGTKTQNIPSASAFKIGQQLIIKDLFGDSAINNIAVIPGSGTIDLAANFTINTAKQSVTLIADKLSNNWLVV